MTDARTPGEETDPTEDLEHHLGGIASAIAGVEATVRPETGRLTVDALETREGGVVDLSLRSDGVNARVFLEPDQAGALADRLATAAEDAEDLVDDE